MGGCPRFADWKNAKESKNGGGYNQVFLEMVKGIESGEGQRFGKREGQRGRNKGAGRSGKKQPWLWL